MLGYIHYEANFSLDSKMNLKELRENYDGVYRMWYGVPILVTFDKLEPKKKCNECGGEESHTNKCVFQGQR